MDPIQAIRGMSDILSKQAAWWQRMERAIAEVMRRYGYGEVRTPILESTELFKRSIGEETDIVEKEMYTFIDRDGSSLTLRPEGTAPAVRSYIENALWKKEPVTRWYYLGSMFRHERPQKGRYRQFAQMGIELIGSTEPAADVEIIDLMSECLSAVGLEDTSLELNSLGCGVCRPGYRASLNGYLEKHQEELCEDCRRRMKANPLRVLDCKLEGCVKVTQPAPRIIDVLCQGCADHFGKVQDGLKFLSIPHRLNHRMVRGLDYYGRTTFEILSGGLGAQNAVAAGGRYDGLVESLGGPKIPAVGFAAGLDRILLKLQDTLSEPEEPAGVFVVTMGDEGWRASLRLVQQLRRAGLKVESDVRQGSLKAQMKRADKAGARFVLILGEDELAEGKVTVKDLAAGAAESGKQLKVENQELPAWLVTRLAAAAAEGRNR